MIERHGTGAKLADRLGRMLYGMTSQEAIEKHICICCKNPPRFKTEAGKAEYQLSGMCEYCFDEEYEE